MSEHSPRTVHRHCDVAVVGGSAAGLAAALQLTRQRRSVIVVDAGDPRNAPATHMHGYLGFNGQPPAALTSAGRDEVRAMGGEILAGRVVAATRADDRFSLELTGGHRITADRVIVATGLVDQLPDIPGLADHWGRGVIHCPFCHGYEIRDQRLVQIVTHPLAFHSVPLFRQLTDRHTVVVHGDVTIDAAQRELLEAAGITVQRAVVTRITDDATGRLTGVEMTDTVLPADVVAVGPTVAARIAPFASLGLRADRHPSGMGTIVATDPRGATSIPGVSAAGNVTDPSHNVAQAAAHGSFVGAMVSFALAERDLIAGRPASGATTDWEKRYSGDPLWSGRPNGALVREVADLPVGRALDVGAGEGGDAIWMAERGWTVTASDISDRALDRMAVEATRRGLTIERLRADANALAPYPTATFDLVTAHYASIPRTPDGRALTNLRDAVAPGGVLLMVTHDPTPMRGPVDTAVQSRMFDVDAFVSVDEAAALLADSPEWVIEKHATVPRPAGAASPHHVDDVVLRARRIA